ncbi:NAD(P)-dependent alcohol dehydrogenase [Maribacter cobaltidurans]|uniref:NAD(P)-dependent alcohol dehydrogenase n=1 Tax=Maribacter cobaltidurans TaxID=1178778 RepID=A0A223V786_9FLAO|nr:NAD(P)-dependent alcohol dehydrogenase [Maribacter cobaltidurans]ASV31000.1 NAD(P)-dependent alcohol dehydrogenase [Maribacter cobaltidurans]GGD90410.1 NADPH:quinone reductase [Maribacter cobaltidurans]
MKAIICQKYGPPEVLKIVTLPKPIPKDKEVLVKIMATAINSADVRIRGLKVKGIMKLVMRLVIGFNKPRKSILGTVFSGRIEAVGGKVTRFKVGDKVFGMTGLKFGTNAEYITINENKPVVTAPKNATFEESAAIIFGGQSAIYFLEKSGIAKKPNVKVLIYGATGSVGTAAVQIAQSHNADITAVSSTRGTALMEKLGVNKVLFYDQGEFEEHTPKYDIVFDAVGKASKKKCTSLLEKDGIFKTVEGMEVASESISQLEKLKELFETERYHAIIDKVFPMDQVVEAHRYVDQGRKKGNVVLRIG